jgi:ubiquinone/menaquinone biosynthesis C-methylase UbiE
MFSLSCTTPDYDKLYAKYLGDPEKILRIAKYDPKKDHMVLDLCGGTGVVSKTMIDMGAEDSILVDINPRAGFGYIVEYKGKKIFQHPVKAENFNFHEDRQFDLIVCRQAVNYLDINRAFKNVADHLLPDGRFVFNTFEKAKRLVSKEYYLNGWRFNETSVKIFNRIFHLQRRNERNSGIEFDISVFRHIPKEKLVKALLMAGFKSINIIYDGENSVYYICRKSEEDIP